MPLWLIRKWLTRWRGSELLSEEPFESRGAWKGSSRRKFLMFLSFALSLTEAVSLKFNFMQLSPRAVLRLRCWSHISAVRFTAPLCDLERFPRSSSHPSLVDVRRPFRPRTDHHGARGTRDGRRSPPHVSVDDSRSKQSDVDRSLMRLHGQTCKAE